MVKSLSRRRREREERLRKYDESTSRDPTKRRESPDWDMIWNKYTSHTIEDDLKKNPEKLTDYKKRPVHTLQMTIRTSLIHRPKRMIKNVDRDAQVLYAGRMKDNLMDFLKEKEIEIVPKIRFKPIKTKTKRIYVYKKGIRGMIKNFPSMRKYRKWRKTQ